MKKFLLGVGAMGISAGCFCQSWVLPWISVNKKATVPVGREGDIGKTG